MPPKSLSDLFLPDLSHMHWHDYFAMPHTTYSQLTLHDCLVALWFTLDIFIAILAFAPYIKNASAYGKLNTSGARGSSLLQVPTQIAFPLFYTVAGFMNAQCLYEVLHADYPTGPITNLTHTLNSFLPVHTSAPHTPELGAVMVMCMFQLHLAARLYECVFVHKFNKDSKQSIIVTAGGLFFYAAFTMSLYCEAVWTTAGGSTAGDNKTLYDQMNVMLYTRFAPWMIAIGACMFGIGWIEQRRSHSILGRLRRQPTRTAAASANANGHKQSVSKASKLLGVDAATVAKAAQTSSVGNAQYAIPYGHWFEAVSMPHYTAEIVVYTAFVMVRMATSERLPFVQILILVWTASNLVITGYRSHLWYKRKFDDYPADRYAVIPYVL